jgi:uncharacterized protein (DUF1778 family)
VSGREIELFVLLDEESRLRHNPCISDTKGGHDMPVSLRIPKEKEEILKKRAKAVRKTKTAFILDAIDEKLGLAKSREQIIRETAGWMSHKDAQELRKAISDSAKVDEEEWQ